ncbi:EmrB/QacA family drug resistance transporter [Pseudomonas syringae pv. rhaphiolepidis]|nr:EmrB/QacA family drug resistance transporter [Pseudomonas syringae pv. rhaphiolepidis]
MLVHGVLYQFSGYFPDCPDAVALPDRHRWRCRQCRPAPASAGDRHADGCLFAGRRTAQTGRYKPLILTGALLMPIAILGMAFTPPQSLIAMSLFMVLTGIATGMQFPTSLVGTQNSVQPRDMGVATSTTNLFRSLGGAVGVALMSALLLAMLQHTGVGLLGSGALGGEGSSGNVLLDSLNAATGPALETLRAELALTFRNLLITSAAISLLGLAAAVAMPNTLLRGRD